MLFFYLLYVALGIYLLFLRKKSCGNELSRQFPAPFGLPVVGHLFFLGKNPAKTFLKWKQKLGPVFQLNLGGKGILVLNDLGSIRECFGREEFAGRKCFKLLDLLMEKSGWGVALNEGAHVREQREFFLKAFREFGMQKKGVEEKIGPEVKRLVEQWHSKEEKPFTLCECFSLHSTNAAWQMLASDRLEEKTTFLISKMIKEFSSMHSALEKLAMVAPWIVNKISGIVGEKVKSSSGMTNLTLEAIKGKRATRVSHQPRDILDKYMDAVEDTADNTSSFHESRGFMGPAVRDILVAASETTASTLTWFVLQMLHNPASVKKLQNELDKVVGPDRNPSLVDKPRLPFVEACILETLRWSSVLPFGLPHSTMVDTEFRGRFVPEGTLVLGNLYAIHHDPEVWIDPEAFRPERFLTTSNTIDTDIRAKVLPFGAGKRVCLGIGFILEELFLFVTRIYHEFNIISPDGLPTLEGVFGIEYVPIVYPNIVATRRHRM